MEPVLPSQVFDKEHIQMPDGSVVKSDEEWNRCGKWILYEPHGDLAFVDSAWTALQQLLDDKTLIMLKASTATMAEEGAVMMCYTRPGKKEAKRAARAVQRVVDFKAVMYYQLNEQTSLGITDRYGDERVSIYMHTYRGGFYTKKYGSWIQDDEDPEEKVVPIDNKFCKEKYSGNKNLPSKHQELCCWNLPETQQRWPAGVGCWFMFCSCEEEGQYLSDADRVWLVAQQLLEEGLFEGLFLRKFDSTPFAEVRLYVPRHGDVYSRLTACDKIFRKASSRTVMYYVKTKRKMRVSEGGFRRPDYDFVYTPDGELYGRTRYGVEYLSACHKDKKCEDLGEKK